MKNNRLTLKALKKELDNLKKSNNKAQITQDIKNSHIKNLYAKSSLFYLWLISWVLYLSNKIPFINRIVTMFSLYYGRTTWWKILVYLRKSFIMFNAIIGVYVVYKTTGFGIDTFWASFIAMGENYLNIFINFNKRLFNWIFDILDYKVVPNVPNSPPKSPPSWWPGSGSGQGILPKKYLWVDEYIKNRKPTNTDWFNSPININSTP